MRKLFYMGLEPYPARYTLQLTEWNRQVFEQQGIDYHVVDGSLLSQDQQIVTGSVLDAHGRSYYSLTQTANLIKLMQSGQVTSNDVIFYEDMFTPGLEALPYIMQQCSPQYQPKVFVRCLAQTIDPDDFVNREGMFGWMRRFEQIADEFVSGIIVASEEMVAHLRIAGFRAPIYVSGLPFGRSEVQQRVSKIPAWCDRPRRVAFASRWDSEKQPEFFMQLAQRFADIDPTVEFAVFSGHPQLKSNSTDLITQAHQLESSTNVNFHVYTGLSKNQYYELLANSQVLFNCALQDWVSNTVSEADALGTCLLFPAYRSFPEVFANHHENMYVPWSIGDAVNKLKAILFEGAGQNIVGHISTYQDQTISRTLEILQGKGSQYARNGNDYRKHVAAPKWKS